MSKNKLMTAAFSRLDAEEKKGLPSKTTSISRSDVMRFLYLEYEMNANLYYDTDELNKEKFAINAMRRLALNDGVDEDLVYTCVEEFELAIELADAQEQDGTYTFRAALLREINL